MKQSPQNLAIIWDTHNGIPWGKGDGEEKEYDIVYVRTITYYEIFCRSVVLV